MKMYKTKDGEVFQANTPLAVVEALKIGSRFDAHKKTDVFMGGMCKRMELYDGTVVRCSSPEVFMEDLVACGWLEVIQ